MQRYFGYFKEDKINIDQEDIHHIKNVMRKKAGDLIEVVVASKCFLCEIVFLDKKIINLKVIEEQTINSELEVDVTIVQALVKDDKMSYVIQKSVELGVNKIIPLLTKRSVIKLNEDKVKQKKARWEKISKEASEQSKRIVIPEIDVIHNINEIVKNDYDLKILCTVNEKVKTIKNILSNIKKYDKLIIVIGPEGGFTDEEESFLVEHGYEMVSLGKRILRTESVSQAVLSMINYELMR